MSRFRTVIASAFAFCSVTLPLFAYGAGFTTIIPQSGACHCDTAFDWGCILLILQTVIADAVYLGIILCVIWIAYAGFSMMVNGGVAEARSIAKTRLLNAVLGIAVILCSWLVVDFVMKTLYNPDTIFEANIFGPWNSILAPNGNDYCIRTTTPSFLTSGMLNVMFGSNPGNTSTTYSTGTGSGACNPTAVASAAAAGQYTLTTAQANTLACLAKPESTCGTNTKGATTVAGKSTSASGPWQITLGASDKCHSLNIPACGNLNCSAAYSGGVVKNDAASVALAQKCQAAANNLSCSASAAACLIQSRKGSFSDWTADSRSHTQKACVSANGGTY